MQSSQQGLGGAHTHTNEREIYNGQPKTTTTKKQKIKEKV